MAADLAPRRVSADELREAVVAVGAVPEQPLDPLEQRRARARVDAARGRARRSRRPRAGSTRRADSRSRRRRRRPSAASVAITSKSASVLSALPFRRDRRRRELARAPPRSPRRLRGVAIAGARARPSVSTVWSWSSASAPHSSPEVASVRARYDWRSPKAAAAPSRKRDRLLDLDRDDDGPVRRRRVPYSIGTSPRKRISWPARRACSEGVSGAARNARRSSSTVAAAWAVAAGLPLRAAPTRPSKAPSSHTAAVSPRCATKASRRIHQYPRAVAAEPAAFSGSPARRASPVSESDARSSASYDVEEIDCDRRRQRRRGMTPSEGATPRRSRRSGMREARDRLELADEQPGPAAERASPARVTARIVSYAPASAAARAAAAVTARSTPLRSDATPPAACRRRAALARAEGSKPSASSPAAAAARWPAIARALSSFVVAASSASKRPASRASNDCHGATVSAAERAGRSGSGDERDHGESEERSAPDPAASRRDLTHPPAGSGLQLDPECAGDLADLPRDRVRLLLGLRPSRSASLGLNCFPAFSCA